MSMYVHEIHDPIHVFVRTSSEERKVIDSRPFQRLRHINQLALTHLVHPGATHKRFEHSLGVMELASKAFEVVTNRENVSHSLTGQLDELNHTAQLSYWKAVLRMAALCHDLGQLPFSCAAEEELLPDGWSRERLTRSIIESDELQVIWNQMTPPLLSEDIARLALGKRHAKDLEFSNWHAVLSEIIVGDALGVDRIDYLLRDSHHAGVGYGKFDHFRLMDALKILPSHVTGEPVLGIRQGGLQSAESMMLTRHVVLSQVYFHPVCRICDIHLKDFLKEWLPKGRFTTDLEEHLLLTDNEITVAMLEAARDSRNLGHQLADRIVNGNHFKLVYEHEPAEDQTDREAGAAVYEDLCRSFGEDSIRRDRYLQRRRSAEFPVELRNGDIVSSITLSEVLNRIPEPKIDSIFAEASILEAARLSLQVNRKTTIQASRKES